MRVHINIIFLLLAVLATAGNPVKDFCKKSGLNQKSILKNVVQKDSFNIN